MEVAVMWRRWWKRGEAGEEEALRWRAQCGEGSGDGEGGGGRLQS